MDNSSVLNQTVTKHSISSHNCAVIIPPTLHGAAIAHEQNKNERKLKMKEKTKLQRCNHLFQILTAIWFTIVLVVGLTYEMCKSRWKWHRSMGFYIETDTHKHKAQFLIDNHHAVLLFEPEYHHGLYTTVCVINNGPFEAAGICFDKHEFQAFNRSHDPRPKTWLKMPTSEVLKLQPLVEDSLER